MDYAEYRKTRQEHAEAQRLAERIKAAQHCTHPTREEYEAARRKQRRSDSFWDHFFYGI